MLELHCSIECCHLIFPIVANGNFTFFRLLELSQRLAEDTDILARCKRLIDADSPSIPLHVFVLEVYDAKIDKGEKDPEMLNHGKQVSVTLENFRMILSS